MKKTITTSLFILAAVALLGLSSLALAEDRVVHVKVRRLDGLDDALDDLSARSRDFR